MITYAGTFAAGFEKIIPSLLEEEVPSAVIKNLESALVIFSTDIILEDTALPFLNNLFVCLAVWNTNSLSFSGMKNNIPYSSLKNMLKPFLYGKTSYRLRFSKENQFCSVDKNLVASLEKSLSSAAGIPPDRLNAKTEIHFIIRRENISFAGLKLTEKTSAEKIYEKGELRGEIVRLMLHIAEMEDEYVICDPFAGYGSIPRRISLLNPLAHIYINDIDNELVKRLEKEFTDSSRFTISSCDACSMLHIQKNTVNLIVTDPPWGSYDGSLSGSGLFQLYKNMLTEFDRILTAEGRAVILTGAKKEFEEAVAASYYFTQSSTYESFKTNVLVNGKKAAVYYIKKNIR